MVQWIIVWCETDKSYSLLRDDDLICDVEQLKVNDEVKFFYNKEEWKGMVCVIGGKSILLILVNEENFAAIIMGPLFFLLIRQRPNLSLLRFPCV